MTFPPSTVLFAGPEDATDEAKKYIANNGYTRDQVKLVIKDGMCQVIVK